MTESNNSLASCGDSSLCKQDKVLKSLNSDNGFDASSHFTFMGPLGGRLTRAQEHGLNILVDRCNYVSSTNQFIRRTTRIWNYFPLDIRESLRHCNTSIQIKGILLPYYKNLRDNHFVAVDTCTWASKCNCPNCR